MAHLLLSLYVRMKINLQSLSKPKVIYPTLFVLLVATICLYTLKEGEKTLRINTQKQLADTTQKKIAVETKLTETTQVKERIEKELDSGKEKICLLEKQLEEKSRQMQLAMDRIAIETAAKTMLNKKLTLVMKEKDILEEKLNRFNFASKPVELEKIVIKQVSDTLVGKVIKVDKKYAFVVLDLGNRDNLKVVDILSVYRSNKFIGKVRVERLEDDRSAAVILPEWQNAQFREGDEVKKV